MNQFLNLFKLQTSLTEFGLNPIEWQLKKLAGNQYQITSTKDPEFKFIGEVIKTQNTLSWKSVTLWSF